METVQNYSVEFLKVHPQNSEFFDDIAGKEYEQFKSSIQNEGILTPLIVAPDMTIISGHQRLKACLELGFDMVPIIIRQDIKSEDDKLVALLAANFGRHKNDDKKQRKVADEYSRLRGKVRGRPEKNSPMGRISQEQIAKELGVSTSELNRMLDIERKLTPEIVQMIDDGIFTKNTASRVIVQLSKEEQGELLQKYGQEIIEGVTQKQMQEYVDQIKGLENQIKGYEIKLNGQLNKQNNNDSNGSDTINELIEERNKLEAEKRKEYERAEQLKKEIEAKEREVERLKNLKPKEIIKEVEKPIVPDDYHKNKEERKRLEEKVKTLQDNLNTERKKVQELTPKTADLPELNFEYFNQSCDAYLQYINMYAYKEIEFSELPDYEIQQYMDAIVKVESYLGKIKNILNIKNLKRSA